MHHYSLLLVSLFLGAEFWVGLGFSNLNITSEYVMKTIDGIKFHAKKEDW